MGGQQKYCHIVSHICVSQENAANMGYWETCKMRAHIVTVINFSTSPKIGAFLIRMSSWSWRWHEAECSTVCAAVWHSLFAACYLKTSLHSWGSSVDLWVAIDFKIIPTSVKAFCDSLKVTSQLSHTQYLLADLTSWLSLWELQCCTKGTSTFDLLPLRNAWSLPSILTADNVSGTRLSIPALSTT